MNKDPPQFGFSGVGRLCSEFLQAPPPWPTMPQLFNSSLMVLAVMRRNYFSSGYYLGGSEIIHVPPVFPHLVRGTTAKQNERPEFTRMVIRKGLRGDLSQFGFSEVGRLCSEI